MSYQLVRNIHQHLIVILAVNLFAFTNLLSIFFQLAVCGYVCIYVGAVLSSSLKKMRYTKIEIAALKKEKEESIKNKSKSSFLIQAIKYPLAATTMLLFLYLLIRYFQKQFFSWFLNLIFIIFTTIYFSKEAIGLFSSFYDRETNIYESSIIYSIVFIVSIFYIVTKHWVLNNLFGIISSILAIKSGGKVNSFKLIFAILWILFAYDMYFVYFSDIMVSVAKEIDLPLKLMFPQYTETKTIQFGMLGLGDIILPGLLVSLCIKYDIDSQLLMFKPKILKNINLPFFTANIIAYVGSIIITFLVKQYSNHAQPALVFIVPICTLTCLVQSVIKNKFDKFWNYDSTLRQTNPKRSKINEIMQDDLQKLQNK